MQKREYLIGDVARLIGVSRDTVRFYEKKGLIASRKRPNGYRYYTESDLARLYGIIFRRSMNFSLAHIDRFWNQDMTPEEYGRELDQKIREEEDSVRQLQAVIANLKAARQDCENISRSLHRMEVRPFPAAYLLKTCESHMDTMTYWFSLGQERKDLSMSYIYDYYHYQSGFSLAGAGPEPAAFAGGAEPDADAQTPETRPVYAAALTEERSCLLLPADPQTAGSRDSGESFDGPMTERVPCVFTVTRSDTWKPDMKVVEAMRAWAAEQGLFTAAEVISAHIMSGSCEGEQIYYLEVYIPVLNAP